MGRPLNGQRRREQIVRDVNRVVEFDRVIETGTYRGTTTEFFSAVFGVLIATVESSPRYYHYSRTRLRDQRNVTVNLGDSRSFLRDLCRAGKAASEIVFIYLDAHWKDDLPLREELEIIGAGWIHAIVMVDDFQVPGDPGYTFDDYGPGKALTASYLPEMAGWEVFYPAAPSVKETGMCRGCVVLTSPSLVQAVTDVPPSRDPDLRVCRERRRELPM